MCLLALPIWSCACASSPGPQFDDVILGFGNITNRDINQHRREREGKPVIDWLPFFTPFERMVKDDRTPIYATTPVRASVQNYYKVTLND